MFAVHHGLCICRSSIEVIHRITDYQNGHIDLLFILIKYQFFKKVLFNKYIIGKFSANKEMESNNLNTERLFLRQLKGEDFNDFFSLYSDLEIMKYIGKGKPLSKEKSWAMLSTLIGQWDSRGYGHWAIEERCSGYFMGHAGFITLREGVA